MAGIKSARKVLKANPEFAAWLKQKPELVKSVNDNPDQINEILASWKTAQEAKGNLLKVASSYRQVVQQIQEMNLLIERLDRLAAGIRSISKNPAFSPSALRKAAPRSSNRKK